MAGLFSDLAKEIAVFVVLAFIIGRTGLFTTFFARPRGWRERLLLALGAGLLGIAGSYWGIPIQGALANARVIGPMVAGLYGGPVAGVAAGLVAGLHRTYLGGFTAVACGISTVSEGALAGFVHRRWGAKPLSAVAAFGATAAAELLQMTIILLVARPWSDAVSLVKIIGLPMTLANAAGVGLMVLIIGDAQAQRDRIAATQAHQTLQIAGRTLPHLREGLTGESALAAARIILDGTRLDAVSITDRGRILAFVGSGSDHHHAGIPPLTQAVWDGLADGTSRQVNTPAQVGCSHPGCPLSAGVIVPLRDGDQVVGTLNLLQKRPGPVSQVTVELGVGLGQLLSNQIEISRVQAMSRLVAQAELRALHAQMNPHFLFNALNTIAAVCRRDPDKARDLLVLLSQYLRASLQAGDGLIALGRELEFVEAYLTIEKVRYGDRLQVETDVPAELLGLRVPILSLQPLVENSVRHGLMPRAAGGTVRIRAQREGSHLVLRVEDDGVGIRAGGQGEPGGNGVGLKNVRERLRHLYGTDGQLSLSSRPAGGTVAELRLPAQEAEAPAPQAGVVRA
ncbi:MAG TPA: LytS/YhcK type 5TM receptor domain-containing protein [Symbiobacteriaceae bacterium]